MILKVVYLVELVEDRRYLFKDNRGCFQIGDYSDDNCGFYTDLHDFVEYYDVTDVWELPNENS